MSILSDELTKEEYAAMSDAEAAVSLNALNRSRDRTSMTASEVLNAVEISEWNALTDVQRQQIWDVLHIGEINPFGVEATIFQNVFGVSTTITSLQDARVEQISRATELGLGVVKVGHVEEARS